MERPDLIVAAAEYPSTCRGFDENKVDVQTVEQDLGASRLDSIKQAFRVSQQARVREHPESNRSKLTLEEKLKIVHDKAWTLSRDRIVSNSVVADALQREYRWKREDIFRLLEELENRRRVSKWGSNDYLVEEPTDRGGDVGADG